MIPEKLAKLIELLTEKTKNKKAIWSKGSGDSQFKISVAEGIAVTISSWTDNWNDHFEVLVFNSNGNIIQRFVTDNNSTSKDYQLLATFHGVASDQYYKVDETMDALLSSVNSDEVIGNIEKLDKAPEEDDLPF
ncbi:MAG: hypothetical protein ABIP95_02385 [Pelobium sp.]